MFRLRKSKGQWPVEALSRVSIFDCVGARDDEENDALAAYLRAFQGSGVVPRSLRLNVAEPSEDCLVHTPRYCLSQLAPEAIGA